MKNKFFITLLLIIGLIFGLVGLVLSFLPLGTIDIIPSFIGLIIGAIIYFLTKKTGIRKKLTYSVIIISFIAILISLFSAIFIKNKVAEDIKFEERIEQSVEEVSGELEEALEDIEELDFED